MPHGQFVASNSTSKGSSVRSSYQICALSLLPSGVLHRFLFDMNRASGGGLKCPPLSQLEDLMIRPTSSVKETPAADRSS